MSNGGALDISEIESLSSLMTLADLVSKCEKDNGGECSLLA